MKASRIDKEKYKKLQALERRRARAKQKLVKALDSTFEGDALKVAFIVVYDKIEGELYGFEESLSFSAESHDVRSNVFSDVAGHAEEFFGLEKSEAVEFIDFYDSEKPN